jgi:hypothetical protein
MIKMFERLGEMEDFAPYFTKVAELKEKKGAKS